MGDNWSLQLKLTDGRGESYARAIDLERATIFSGMTPRFREEMAMGADLGVQVPGATFDGVVDMMKRREFRRKAFVAEAIRLAHVMADHMEDADGWHGLDRAESAREA